MVSIKDTKKLTLSGGSSAPVPSFTEYYNRPTERWEALTVPLTSSWGNFFELRTLPTEKYRIFIGQRGLMEHGLFRVVR